MGLLQDIISLNDNQRKIIAILTLVFAMTSAKVQAAELTRYLPEATKEETDLAIQDDAAVAGLRVPTTPEAKKAESPPPSRIEYVTVTAYASVPWQTDSTPFITADGTRVRDGIVAANHLKLGTRLRIPELFGDKVFEVHDRMNARYRNRLDIWMPTVHESRKFGLKRKVKIEIL